MHTTKDASFDAAYPYRLSETDHARLLKALGVITALCGLSGQASMANKAAAPCIRAHDLHLALWSVQDDLEAVVVIHNGEQHETC